MESTPKQPRPLDPRAMVAAVPLQAWPVGIAMAVLVAIAFKEPIGRMVDIWLAEESYYSHGPLVPLVALYLVWRQREVFMADPARVSWLGLGFMLAGLAVLVVSGWMVVFFTAGFGLILVLWGMGGFLFGPGALRRLAFPALVLCFMVPPPLQMIDDLSLRLKMLATALSLGVIETMGIVAVNDGQTIYLGDAQVTVGDACSGLRSLISLIFLGMLFACLSDLTLPRRVALFLAAAPIAIASNMARVVGLSLVAYGFGSEAVGGWVHDLSGYMIFVVAFLLLYATMAALQFRLPRAGPDRVAAGAPTKEAPRCND